MYKEYFSAVFCCFHRMLPFYWHKSKKGNHIALCGSIPDGAFGKRPPGRGKGIDFHRKKRDRFSLLDAM
jgi:hypothetical protein